MSNESKPIEFSREEVEALIEAHLIARGARRLDFMTPKVYGGEFEGYSAYYYGKKLSSGGNANG